MTISRSINYETSNKKVSKILIEKNRINILIPYDNEIFEYKKIDGSMNKIIIAEFNYKGKIVNQAFYQCVDKHKGTWFPFNGIKADVTDDNAFYTFFETDPDDKFFGKEELKSVSYVLGGGVWMDPESDFSKSLNVEPRASYTDSLNTRLVYSQDSIYLNHYINYAITDNYLSGKTVKWLDGEELKSAFQYSNKMNNSNQMEYTPKRIKNAKSRSDYSQIYAKINNSRLKIVSHDRDSYCSIL